jgi:hypothetical protein
MKTAVYSSLTMPQRLRAMVCAFGRADHEELDRLADSSPDGCGTIQKVKHHFRNLSHLATIHNVWLLDPCANWLFSQTISAEEVCDCDARELQATELFRNQSIVEAASVEAAFAGRINGIGITTPDWQAFRERLLGPGAKVLLQLFMPKTSGREDPDLVAQYEEALEGYLFKDAA